MEPIKESISAFAKIIKNNPSTDLEKLCETITPEQERLAFDYIKGNKFFERCDNSDFDFKDLAIFELGRMGYYDERLFKHLSNIRIQPFEINEGQDTQLSCYLGRLVDSENKEAAKKAIHDFLHVFEGGIIAKTLSVLKDKPELGFEPRDDYERKLLGYEGLWQEGRKLINELNQICGESE